MNGSVVYGDVLFLINFSMDLLVLFCTSRILRHRQNPWRLVIASALGGIYAVGALFIENNAVSLVCNAAAAFVMCLISFPRVRGFAFLKCAALFYGLSVLIGGCITASYVLLSKLGRGVNVNSDIAPALSDIPLGVFLISGAVSAALSFITGRIYNRQSLKKEVTVTVCGDRGAVRLRCLSDSGALLREPLSGAPVIITNAEAVKECVSPELYDALCSEQIKASEGIRLIPGGTVSGKCLLRGFVPRSVTVCGADRDAVVAVVRDAELGGFDGIVPASLCQ